MKIGELAQKAQTPVETIRFYEREGLLPEPARTESNYRAYAQSQLETLQFILRCRSLDMALDEIRQLLRFREQPDVDCGEVNALLDEHIEHVAQRIKELRGLERQLKELRSSCLASRSAQNCGILNGLSKQGPAPMKSRTGAGGHVHGSHRKH